MKDEKKSSGVRERNLLFGVMAVQLHFITADEMARAAGAWAASPEQDLGSILQEMGFLDAHKRSLIEQLLELHLQEHGHDVHETLKSFGGERAVEKSFGPALAGGGKGEEQEDRTLPSFGGEEWSGPTRSDWPAAAEIDNTEKVSTEQPGHYTLRGEAGHGAMGQVLVAFDEHIGRLVAVKELLPEPYSSRPGSGSPASRPSAQAAARFLREARITGQLEHPGVVPVYEIGRRPSGSLYYTMKLVRGQTLADKLREIKERRPLASPAERKKVAGKSAPGSSASSALSRRLALLPHFLDLCQTMAYAHSKGVIHRDLKPANVMVGEFGETVVLDWGLAKVRGIEDVRSAELEENLKLIKEASAGETVRGKPIGTPAYMSPEQAEGDIPNIDERSDVWSLGAILYELLTGHLPFGGSTAYEVMGRVISAPLPDPRQSEPAAPPELCAIAAKCLAKDRTQRYAHAGELAADIHSFLSGGLVSAYEYSMTALVRRWLKKRWPLAATAAAGLAALLVLGVWSYVEIRAEKETALAHERRALAEKARAEAREQEARLNLAEAYYQMGAQAEKKNLWNDAALYYARSLTLDEREPSRSGYYQARLRPLQASLLRSIRGHEQAVMTAAFSPNGKQLLSGSCSHKESGMCTAGELKLWNTENGELLHTVQAHEDYIRAVAFAPDGRVALSASWDNTLKLWDLSRWESLFTLRGHSDDIYAAAFSPDGTLIASAGSDGAIHLWEVGTGALLHVLPSPGFAVNSVAFTPDGKELLAAGGDGVIEVWSVEKREKLQTLSGHSYIVEAVAVSPDGHYAASGSWDKTVKLWDMKTGECLRTFTGHEDRLFTVAFSPDGQLIASGGLDKTLRLWSALSGENLLSLPANDDLIQAAVFSPDGKVLAVASSDHTIKLWHLESGTPPTVLRAAQKIIWSVHLSPDGRQIAAAVSDDSLTSSLRLWSAPDGQLLRSFDPQPYPYLSFAFSPDGRKIISGGCQQSQGFDCQAGELKLWDTDTGTLLQSIASHETVINTVAFSPDGRHAASGSCGKFNPQRGCVEGEIKIWDVEAGALLQTLAAHQSWVSSLLYLPDGRRLLSSGGLDASLKLWDLNTGSCLFTLTGHSNLINMIALSPDGKTAASASFDKTIKLWDIEVGRLLQTIPAHEVGLKSVSFSSDGKYLLSGGWDHNIKIWDRAAGTCLLTLRGHEAPVSAVFFSPDRETLVSAGDDQNIKIWPLRWELLTQSPKKLLRETETITGLHLEGFKLVPGAFTPASNSKGERMPP